MRSKTTTMKCGTCEYWTGKRKPVFNEKSIPMVDVIDTFGECQNTDSRFCDQKRGQGVKCVHYSKWTELF